MDTNDSDSLFKDLSQEDIKKLNDEDISSLIFNEAKEKLKAAIEFSNELDKKIYNLIILIMTVFSAATGFFVKIDGVRFTANCSIGIWRFLQVNALALLSIVFLISLMYTLFCLFRVTKPKIYYTTGSSPKDLIDPKIFSQVVPLFRMSIAEQYQTKISLNAENQEIKAKHVDDALCWLKWAIRTALALIILRFF